MEAAMNSAEASNSFSPLALGNRLLESTQMSTGIMQIRISVMEFGRFTCKDPLRETSRGDTRLSSSGICESNGALGPRNLFLLRRFGRCHRAPVSDDLVFDLLVSGFWHDFPGHQIAFCPVRPSVNDLLCVFLANTGECVQFVLRGRVDVQLLALWHCRTCRFRTAGRRSFCICLSSSQIYG